MTQSRKLIRLTIMDALDRVLKGRSGQALSSRTKMIIIEAVEKIAESVEQDFYDGREAKPLKTAKKINTRSSTDKSADVASVQIKNASTKRKTT